MYLPGEKGDSTRPGLPGTGFAHGRRPLATSAAASTASSTVLGFFATTASLNSSLTLPTVALKGCVAALSDTTYMLQEAVNGLAIHDRNHEYGNRPRDGGG